MNTFTAAITRRSMDSGDDYTPNNAAVPLRVVEFCLFALAALGFFSMILFWRYFRLRRAHRPIQEFFRSGPPQPAPPTHPSWAYDHRFDGLRAPDPAHPRAPGYLYPGNGYSDAGHAEYLPPYDAKDRPPKYQEELSMHTIQGGAPQGEGVDEEGGGSTRTEQAQNVPLPAAAVARSTPPTAPTN